MSDPVTNVDVEDVLSSIRRLVSNTEEKLHPAPKPERSEEEQEAFEAALSEDAEDSTESAEMETAQDSDTPAADALVLTSALRVNDPATEADIPEDIDPGEGSAVLDNLRSALSQDQADDYEDDGTDEEAIFETQEDAPEGSFDLEDAAEDFSAEENAEDSHWAEQSWAEEEPQEEDQPEETTEAESSDSVEENEHSDDNWKLEEEAPSDWQEETAESSDEEGSDVETADAEQEMDDHPAEFSSARAHLEPAEEPVEDGEHTEPEEATVFHQDAGEDEQGVDLGDFDEAVIDEEMLRDLVAEIVRQELTGALGERITRNVRKLVRREIHRAMLTRDFD